MAGWPKKAPFGSINKHDKNSAWVEVDTKNSPFVTEAFKEMATGKWTLQEWADHTHSLGYRSRNGYFIRKTAWSDIFHNRFYLGETWLKKGDASIKGSQQPLVDESTFVQVQQVLRQYDKNKQRSQRHKYLLRGLVHSVDADSTCWAETHPKKRVSYYRSVEKVNGSNVYYNTKDIEEQLPAIFKDITITEKARQGLRKELVALFEAKANGDGETQKAENRLAKLERMEKNLQRLVIEEQISFEDFKEHHSQIEAERARMKNTVDAVRQRQHLVKADFEVALELATQPHSNGLPYPPRLCSG